jgi:hypothetical protein
MQRLHGSEVRLQMLDALNHREADDDLPRFRARVPVAVFTAAYRELCTRIWLELEQLGQSPVHMEGGPSQDLTLRAATLRLEIVILVDSCRSPHWRDLLGAAQCDSLCALLTDVSTALYVEQELLLTGIAEAQDRLLDELLPPAEQEHALGDAA